MTRNTWKPDLTFSYCSLESVNYSNWQFIMENMNCTTNILSNQCIFLKEYAAFSGTHMHIYTSRKCNAKMVIGVISAFVGSGEIFMFFWLCIFSKINIYFKEKVTDLLKRKFKNAFCLRQPSMNSLHIYWCQRMLLTLQLRLTAALGIGWEHPQSTKHVFSEKSTNVDAKRNLALDPPALHLQSCHRQSGT